MISDICHRKRVHPSRVGVFLFSTVAVTSSDLKLAELYSVIKMTGLNQGVILVVVAFNLRIMITVRQMRLFVTEILISAVISHFGSLLPYCKNLTIIF